MYTGSCGKQIDVILKMKGTSNARDVLLLHVDKSMVQNSRLQGLRNGRKLILQPDHLCDQQLKSNP